MAVPPLPTDRQDGTTIRAAHLNQVAEGVNDLQQQIDDLPPGGYSAYELWLQEGNTGSPAAYQEWLKSTTPGPEGPEGDVSTAGIGPGGVGFRPQGDIADWFDRLAAAPTAAVDVVVIGDSIAAQGDIAEPAWPWLLGQSLARRADTPPPSDQLVYAAPSGAVPRVSGPGGTLWAGGLGGWGTTLATGQSLSHVGACDAASVLWGRQSGGGTLTVRDGGPSGTVLATIDTSGAERASQRWTSDALTYGPRTLHLSASGGPVRVEALYLHRATLAHGVRVWPAVHHGWTSEQFTTTPGLALDLIADLDAAGTLGLVVVATGTNDADPPDAVAALLDAVQGVTSAPVAQWVGFRNNQLDRGEIAGLRQLALDRGSLLIDADTYAPRFAADWTLDGTHPLQTAQPILARHVEAILSGDPIGTVVRDAPRLGPSAAEAAPGDIMSTHRDRVWRLDEDFMGGDATTSGEIGELGWTRLGGATEQQLVNVADRLGVLRLRSTGTQTVLHYNPPDDLHAHQRRLTWWVRCPTTDATHSLGVANFGTGDTQMLEAEPGATTWQAVTLAGGSETHRLDTGVSRVADRWYRLEMISDGTGVWCLIDGQFVGALPTVASGALAASITATGSASDLWIDRVELVVQPNRNP